MKAFFQFIRFQLSDAQRNSKILSLPYMTLVVVCLDIWIIYETIIHRPFYYASHNRFGCTLIFVLLMGCTIKLLHDLRNGFHVFLYSKKLKQIIDLKEEFLFESSVKPKTYRRTVETRKEFDRFDFDGFLYEVIREEFDDISKLYQEYCDYVLKYQEYMNKVQNIIDSNCSYCARIAKVPFNTFDKIETSYISKEKIAKPYVEYLLALSVHYSSPAGRKHLTKRKEYNKDEVKNAIDDLPDKITRSVRYNPQFERSFMNDSLRYDILKRDGFRCQICGMSQKDGIKLHVDHIVPVAKGGRTIPSNLRTLCEACNKGKRDKYDPKGLN